VMGVQHVGLGSDFDGTTKTPWDTRGVIVITDALLKAGLSADDASRVMGGNALEYLMRTLPGESR